MIPIEQGQPFYRIMHSKASHKNSEIKNRNERFDENDGQLSIQSFQTISSLSLSKHCRIHFFSNIRYLLLKIFLYIMINKSFSKSH